MAVRPNARVPKAAIDRWRGVIEAAVTAGPTAARQAGRATDVILQQVPPISRTPERPISERS